MVACDWPSDGRQWFGVVEALHVLVANLRAGSRAALICDPPKCSRRPCLVGRADARVYLWRRPAAGLLRLAQRSGYPDGGPGLVDALMAGEGQMCGARGGRRDVGGRVQARVCGRVLRVCRVCRLAVCVVLVGSMCVCVVRNRRC